MQGDVSRGTIDKVLPLLIEYTLYGHKFTTNIGSTKTLI